MTSPSQSKSSTSNRLPNQEESEFPRSQNVHERVRNHAFRKYIKSQLEHPNIIEIYEVYDNPVYFYIVMEYCEGGELYSNNNLHRLSTEKQIAEVVLTITDALDFCHSKSIVHRDIKVN